MRGPVLLISNVFWWFSINRNMQDLGRSCQRNPLPLDHTFQTSSLLLLRDVQLMTLLLVVMSVTLQQHISHATGWSGMWMTACWEVNLYSCCCDAHSSVCKKINLKKKEIPALRELKQRSHRSDRHTMNLQCSHIWSRRSLKLYTLLH